MLKRELRSFKQIAVTREMGKGVKAKFGFQVSICFYFHPTGYSVAAQGRKKLLFKGAFTNYVDQILHIIDHLPRQPISQN